MGMDAELARVCLFPQKSELGDLQRKSPDDLWKGDLAAFVEELDVSFASSRSHGEREPHPVKTRLIRAPS